MSMLTEGGRQVNTDARFNLEGPRAPGGRYPFAAPAAETASWLAGHGMTGEEALALAGGLVTAAAADPNGISRAFWDGLVLRGYDDGTVSVANY